MKHKIKSTFTSIILLAVLFFSGCYETTWDKHITDDNEVETTLMEVIQSEPDLSIFAALLIRTGYDEVLNLSNNYTVFAPVNSAWTDIDTANISQMRKMIGSIIVYNTYFTKNPELYTSVKSVTGKNIYYDTASSSFNGAKITKADIRAANGVVQITDKIVERRLNIWEFVSTKTNYSQYAYINSLNEMVMDYDKSIAVGIDPVSGSVKYDTVWKNMNNFLAKIPIDSEDSIYTYIVVGNAGFDLLYDKYKRYFNLGNEAKTDSLTKFNICQDFVFKGIVDITAHDTLTNIDGVKVPVKNATVLETYNTSNGRVYIINQSDIKLKSKIRPIYIEGENFNRAFDANLVYTRYKLWARGERDIALAAAETQSDTLWRKVPLAPDTIAKKDSIASKTYFLNSGLVANVANFYIEYKANVNSADYDLYYVAYDDIADHFDPTYMRYGVYKIVQKLFVSMPGAPVLNHGIPDNARGVANNYLGNSRCFVGHGLAGVHELTKLKQWNLVQPTQLISDPVANAEVMTVGKAGALTMWLTNTARSNTANRQGLLFLDYILLVPRITEE
jgi:uncharacterized surface protein with fasciclin (FAS1) repeats